MENLNTNKPVYSIKYKWIKQTNRKAQMDKRYDPTKCYLQETLLSICD